MYLAAKTLSENMDLSPPSRPVNGYEDFFPCGGAALMAPTCPGVIYTAVALVSPIRPEFTAACVASGDEAVARGDLQVLCAARA